MMTLFIFINGCTKETVNDKDAALKKMTVKKEASSKALHFNGIIKPLVVENILSPVEGTVDKLFFFYGQSVAKQQPLLIIKSSKIEQDFQSEVTAYLKALDDYNDKSRKFTANEELWRLKFISQDEYLAGQNAKNEAYLSYRQSKNKLRQMMEKLGIKESIEAVNFKNYDLLEKVLFRRQDELTVKSDYAGIVLLPEKTQGNDSNSVTEIQAGSQVKIGDVLFAIVDLKSLAVTIDVDEIDINEIKPNEAATITGPGFPGIVLEGFVQSVRSQAKTENGAAPVFTVTIAIPQLPPNALKTIHVGMSAKVTINVKQAGTIFIPIEAVFQKEGKNWVTVETKKEHQLIDTPVETGETTLDSVRIHRGLQEGDIIVYPH